MQVKPNRTLVCGQVRANRTQPDGWGAEMDIGIEANKSTDPASDF